jgi:AAA+ superfamily predicted ATPase
MFTWPWASNPIPHTLRGVIQQHLTVRLDQAQSVTHSLHPSEQINVQLVVDRWAAEETPPIAPLGYIAGEGYFGDDTLVRGLVVDRLIRAPVERQPFDCELDKTFDGVTRGMFLLHRKSVPVVIAFRPVRMPFEFPCLEVIAPTREAASGTVTAILEEARRSSVYKGRAIAIERSGVAFVSEAVNIRFHDIRPTAREDIVLPEELLQVIERNVLGMLRHAPALRAAGRSLRRGLLFHGPPGTGKTMTVRYLIQACRDHTIVLLTRSQPPPVREACQIARLLAPSIVVLEDVDMLAEDRQTNPSPNALHELLNEMDGIGAQDEVTFLLTSNRPEVLEPALSGRPGRIDQAIAFPLPDEPARRRLFEVYGRGLDLGKLDVDTWVRQTAGTSPAFIAELLRKASLFAAERSGATEMLQLTHDDVHRALNELVLFGGELTQRLLGYRHLRIGYQSGVS